MMDICKDVQANDIDCLGSPRLWTGNTSICDREITGEEPLQVGMGYLPSLIQIRHLVKSSPQNANIT